MLRKIKRILAWYKLKKTDQLYQNADYLDAYSKHTDIRVDWDHKSAIGGDWELLGLLQFNFLRDQGLHPDCSLLDIGMGTLRGGQHFIGHLNNGKYTGFDISPKAVEFSKKFVRELGLDHKQPSLLLNSSKKLDFEFLDSKYDFILAQSVFSHLLEEHIQECFQNLPKIMHPSSRFYFTILESNEIEIRQHKDVYYPLNFFKNLSEMHGLYLEDLSKEYNHPKGQKMLMVYQNSK